MAVSDSKTTVSDSIFVLQDLGNLCQQLQDQTDTLETLRRELGVVKKQLSEAKEDIRSNLEYRARHNGEVLEMKKQIQRLGDLPTMPPS